MNRRKRSIPAPANFGKFQDIGSVRCLEKKRTSTLEQVRELSFQIASAERSPECQPNGAPVLAAASVARGGNAGAAAECLAAFGGSCSAVRNTNGHGPDVGRLSAHRSDSF